MKTNRYTYKGKLKVKVSRSVSITYPFSKTIIAKSDEDARAELHTILFNDTMKIHPSLIDLHIEIEGKHIII